MKLTTEEIKYLVEITPGWEWIICDQSVTERIVIQGFDSIPYYVPKVLDRPSWNKIHLPLLLSQACDELGVSISWFPDDNVFGWAYHADGCLVEGTDYFKTANEARIAAIRHIMKDEKE